MSSSKQCLPSYELWVFVGNQQTPPPPTLLSDKGHLFPGEKFCEGKVTEFSSSFLQFWAPVCGATPPSRGRAVCGVGGARTGHGGGLEGGCTCRVGEGWFAVNTSPGWCDSMDYQVPSQLFPTAGFEGPGTELS